MANNIGSKGAVATVSLPSAQGAEHARNDVRMNRRDFGSPFAGYAYKKGLATC